MKKKDMALRLGQMVIVLFGITFITFLLTYLAPGDPAAAMYEAAGISPTPEQLENARIAMGLDQSFWVQYGRWLTNALHGDLGVSFSRNLPVIEVLLTRLWPTVKMAVFSLLLMLIISLPLGILSAVWQDGPLDYMIRMLSFVGISMPGFWLGLLLIYFVCLKLHLLPVMNSGTDITAMILPATTLAIAMSSKYTRQVRTAVLEELGQDYVVGARARGIKYPMILVKHVLPNAMLPLITMLGLSFGSLLGGTSVVEVIFSYPGLGNLAVSAVTARDYPMIQGFVLWIALIYMVVNLVVDISYNLIDPRMREGGGKA